MNETNERYSWNSEKRNTNIAGRGLDFVALADLIFDDPNTVIMRDDRNDYGEDRFLAYGVVGELRLCLCFTCREDKTHLITIFRVNEKNWRKHYEKNS
jgi:uncharacterized DUF497 family protein